MNATLPVETLRLVISLNEKEAAEVRAALGAPVLDGTPYLLTVNDNGLTRIYGTWPQLGNGVPTVGYASTYAVPHHLCGAATYSEKSADACVEMMRKSGVYPARTARKMHCREFLLTRLGMVIAAADTAKAMLADIEAAGTQAA